jgi:urease accessory protein
VVPSNGNTLETSDRNASAMRPHPNADREIAPQHATQREEPLAAGWAAEIELGYEVRAGRTVLARRRHVGPLAVQRPFHPESDGTCHTYLLHPPGGVVGGDRLCLRAHAGRGARVLLTTPAATKLYRSGGRPARVIQHVIVGTGARCEWLPQETIAYAGADVSLETRFELEPGATLLAWEVTCLGRPASGERFEHGCVEQRLQVVRAGEPVLLERARYAGGAAVLSAPWGLSGLPVAGTFVCSGGERSAGVIDEVRAVLASAADGEAACTELAHSSGSTIVCRYRGRSAARALLAFRAAWAVLRMRCFGAPAVPPRIWAT